MRAVSVIAGLLLFGTAVSAHGASRTFERRIAADANGIVEISSHSGAINVVGWDRSEVEVKAVLDEEVDHVKVSSDRGRTFVEVVSPHSSKRNDAKTKMTIRVPRDSELRIVTVIADIEVKQVLGVQRLQTIKGEVRTEVSSEDLYILNVTGNITVRGVGKPTVMRLNAVSGNVKLVRGAGEVDVTSVNGEVQVDMESARRVRLHSTSGNLIFRGQLARNGTFDAETVSGKVALNAGGEAGYEYEASSLQGEIDNCFGTQVEKVSGREETQLNGTLGDGGARLRIRTMSGDINLCDK